MQKVEELPYSEFGHRGRRKRAEVTVTSERVDREAEAEEDTKNRVVYDRSG